MPGEPTGIPGAANAVDVGRLAQEPADQLGRHVAFDDVVADQRGVAGQRLLRHAGHRLDRVQVLQFP